jgi:hypothetical protein
VKNRSRISANPARSSARKVTRRDTSGRSADALVRQNMRLAKRSMPETPEPTALYTLRDLTANFGFSMALGDLLYLDGKWYVTHAGLLRLARRNRCSAIQVTAVRELCDPDANRWVFKATVRTSGGPNGFVGYGDADPSNTSFLVRGCELRVAETRAVNRALRKAYGIGLCSVEEFGHFSPSPKPLATPPQASSQHGSNGSGNDQPRLRDRLCLLIRQHKLDPNLVKAYAADFCGTQTLKEAGRDLVESFIAQLAAFAKKDRDGLICKLNSYAHPVEATP